jgi:hypothetical protein
MERKETFATAIGCMDGRTQQPAADFIRRRTGAEYVDTITDPGIVQQFAEGTADPLFLSSIERQVDISVRLHNSQGIVISAHSECAGNPVDDEVQIQQLGKAAEVIRALTPEGFSVPVYAAFIQRAVDTAEGWYAREIDVTPETLSSRREAYEQSSFYHTSEDENS